MTASSVQRHVVAVGRAGHEAAARSDRAGAVGHHVAAENNVRDGDLGVQTVVDHEAGACAFFLGRLEEEDAGSGPGGLGGGEERGAGKEGSHVHVVATGVHDGLLGGGGRVRARVDLAVGGGVGQVGLFEDGEAVCVGS